MKSMNFFGGNNKSKENTKSKKKEHSKEFKELAVNLASKIGVTKAAEELGYPPAISTLGRRLLVLPI